MVTVRGHLVFLGTDGLDAVHAHEAGQSSGAQPSAPSPATLRSCVVDHNSAGSDNVALGYAPEQP